MLFYQPMAPCVLLVKYLHDTIFRDTRPRLLEGKGPRQDLLLATGTSWSETKCSEARDGNVPKPTEVTPCGYANASNARIKCGEKKTPKRGPG